MVIVGAKYRPGTVTHGNGVYLKSTFMEYMVAFVLWFSCWLTLHPSCEVRFSQFALICPTV